MAIIDTIENNGLQKSQSKKQIKFGINDARFVQKILRSDVYSNKPKIIVQEYLSNARDAHREAGNVLTPIDVTLPLISNNKIFEIRDYGLGVDPDRFEKVFVQYGSSTKRDSNKEVGGFGIGAKSAWAYTNEFFVTTWTPENDNMMERKYRCYVSDDGWSYGEQLYEKINNEEKRGTKISLQLIDDEDIEKFVRNFHNVTYFWGVKPKVINQQFRYSEWDTITAFDNWILFDSNNGIRNGPVAILDGIPYAVLPEELNIEDERVLRLVMEPIHFHVDTGEVSVALNRESLNYDVNTVTYLRKILTDITNDMFFSIKSQLSHKNNLWEAETEWIQKYRNTKVGSIIKTCEWKDIEVGSNPYKVNYEVKKVTVRRSSHKDYKHNFIIRKTMKIKFDYDFILIVNDSTKAPSPNILMTIFNEPENLDINNAFIINVGPISTYSEHYVTDYEKWAKDFNLQHLNPFFTSQYAKWKGKVEYKPRPKLSVKQANIVHNNFYNRPVLQQISVNIDSDDTGWYFKTERGVLGIDYDNRRLNLSSSNLATILKDLFPNDSVYIVPKPLWNRIGKMKNMKLIDNEILSRCRARVEQFDLQEIKKLVSFRKYKNNSDIRVGTGLRAFLESEERFNGDPLFSKLKFMLDEEDSYYNKKIIECEKIKKYDIESKIIKELGNIVPEKPTEVCSLDVIEQIYEKYPIFEIIHSVPDYSIEKNFIEKMNLLIERLSS